MRTHLACTSLAIAMFAATPLLAQSGTAAGWSLRYDRAGAPEGSMTIAAMGGGYHFTTTGRGAAVAWRPDLTASGNFTATVDLTASSTSAHQEGYGLILGGQALDSANQQYLYFLVRP